MLVLVLLHCVTRAVDDLNRSSLATKIVTAKPATLSREFLSWTRHALGECPSVKPSPKRLPQPGLHSSPAPSDPFERNIQL